MAFKQPRCSPCLPLFPKAMLSQTSSSVLPQSACSKLWQRYNHLPCMFCFYMFSNDLSLLQQPSPSSPVFQDPASPAPCPNPFSLESFPDEPHPNLSSTPTSAPAQCPVPTANDFKRTRSVTPILGQLSDISSGLQSQRCGDSLSLASVAVTFHTVHDQ